MKIKSESCITEKELPKPFKDLNWEEVGAVDSQMDLYILDPRFLEDIINFQYKRFLSLGKKKTYRKLLAS